MEATPDGARVFPPLGLIWWASADASLASSVGENRRLAPGRRHPSPNCSQRAETARSFGIGSWRRGMRNISNSCEEFGVCKKFVIFVSKKLLTEFLSKSFYG